MRNFFKKQLWLVLYRHVAALLLIALIKLVLTPFEPYLTVQIITLIFLLPIVLAAVLWGLTPGILAAIAAFLTVNYFYIPPYGTFQVHRTQDLITLIIFLIVSGIISQLIARAREALHLSQSREWEATRMYELISSLASLQDTPSIAQALADYTLDTFMAQRVDVVLPSDDLKLNTYSAMNAGRPLTRAAPLVTVPLQTARGQEGQISIWRKDGLTKEENRLLEAYTAQGALSMERVRLARGEARARVLEESDKLKSSLLNSVSHELRSPLAAIKASVSSLRSGAVGWNTADREELLAMIEEESDHLNLLVGNLLDMSRIESGALKPQRNWNSLGEIVNSAAAKMRKEMQNHHLSIELPSDLPLVPTDYILIEQVFVNLLSNSVKYAPERTAITIKARVEDECLQVCLTNQSPKVPEEQLERIFDKFNRITLADKVMGTGLGLSICKGIIEAHGGRIWAENWEEGVAFNFTLPLTLDGALPAVPKEAADE